MDELLISESTRIQLEKVRTSLPQGLIIHGKKGIGTGAIARALAEQCGTILATVYPRKRQTNGDYAVDMDAGTILIDDIRALYERTRSKFDAPQIVIIDFAGRAMSPGAQNAFLKLLEEPQPMIHFILALSDVSSLLPTVISRCQKIDVHPISEQQSVQLIETLGITDQTERTRILFIASGLPAEITQLATDTQYYATRIKTVQDARAVLSGDAYARMIIFQRYKDKRPLALQLIDDMIRQLQLALSNTADQSIVSQMDELVTAYDRIRANGAIQLNIAKVLL